MHIEQTKDEPGKIHYPGRAKQIIDFSGISLPSAKFKNSIITPTDIDGGKMLFSLDIKSDGTIEFNREGFIYFELKLKDAPFLYGQKLYYQSLIDALSLPAVVFVADHDIDDPSKDIIASDAIVREYYCNEKCTGVNNGMWIKAKGNASLKSWFDKFAMRYFNKPKDFPPPLS